MTENAQPPATARHPWYKRLVGLPAPGQPPKPKRNGYNGLILTKRGDAEVYPTTSLPVVRREGGGLYLKESHARFWLNKPIPAGWVTVWVEDDAEPVSHRQPAGYGPKTLDLLTGSHIVHVVGGGFRGEFKVKGWMMWVIIGCIALAAGVGLYIWYKAKFGGAK